MFVVWLFGVGFDLGADFGLLDLMFFVYLLACCDWILFVDLICAVCCLVGLGWRFVFIVVIWLLCLTSVGFRFGLVFGFAFT